MTLHGESYTGSPESKTLCMCGRSMLENREISEVSGNFSKSPERLGKVCGHNPNMYATEKSDTVVVPEKGPNKVDLSKSAAEVLEERTVTKGNSEKTACDLNAVTGVNIERT